jgi:hypothetical protein
VLRESLPLLLNNRIGLDLTASNLVLKIARGLPVAVQLRSLDATLVGASLRPLAEAAGFETWQEIPDLAKLYQSFALRLLKQNLLPVITALCESGGLKKSEVLWDCAIETILEGIANNSVLTVLDQQQAANALLLDELDPGTRACQSQVRNNCVPNQEAVFNAEYRRRGCCQKFRKGSRCFNCVVYC